MARAAADLVGGAALLFRGLVLVLRRPRLFWLGAVPPLITSVVFLGLLALVGVQLDRLTRWLTPFADRWDPGAALAVRILVGVALLAGLLLIMVVSFTALTLAVGGPWYDKISEFIEQECAPATGEAASPGNSVGRSVLQSLGLIAASVVVAAAVLIVGFVPVVGQLVAPVASAVLGGWLLGIELLGSAFERHGRLTIGDRRAAMRRHRARVLGLTVPTFLLLAVPFLAVLVFPAATAAGTLLARDLLGLPSRPAARARSH